MQSSLVPPSFQIFWSYSFFSTLLCAESDLELTTDRSNVRETLFKFQMRVSYLIRDRSVSHSFLPAAKDSNVLQPVCHTIRVDDQ